MERTIKKSLSFGELTIIITEVGEDLHLLLTGGKKPHVGCTVLAVPRPSLTGSGEISATSSVLNLTGHKDEAICRYLAEEAAKRKNAVAVCTGGFHVDDITKEQIEEVLKAVKDMVEMDDMLCGFIREV